MINNRYEWKPDPCTLTKEMVSIESYSFMPRQEEEISLYIENFFKAHNIKTWRHEIEPGRFNTYAILEGSDPKNAHSLLLTGHMDTVPAYDMEEAFVPKEDDEFIYGRGTCDMKGGLACMMAAMVQLKDEGVKLKGDLLFCGVADEEEAGIGERSYIKEGPWTDYAIIGEPSDFKIDVGQKGLEWIEISFKGKKVHGGAQDDGVNAIMMAARFIERLEREYLPVLATRTHPVLGHATLNIGTINGGDQPSTVADHCKVRLDRRSVPGETIEQVYAELREIADQLHKEDPKFECEIYDVFNGETLPHRPFCTSEDELIVVAAKNALKDNGYEPKTIPCPAWTDAGFIAGETTCKCIILGPGDLSVCHSIYEKISKEDLNKAVTVYKSIAMQLCEKED